MGRPRKNTENAKKAENAENAVAIVEQNKKAITKKKTHNLYPTLEKGDNSRFLRHALEGLNLPPIDISDAEAVRGRVSWYFQHCVENDMKPGILGLCNSLGISRMTFNNWERERKHNRGEHAIIVRQAKSLIEEMMEQYMMNGKINPVSGIFLMKNNFDGYYDRQDLVVTPNSPLEPEQNREELEKKYCDNDIIEEE